MDPTAAAIAALTADTRTQAREAAAALRAWIGRRGYRPTLTDIEAQAARQGLTLSPRWRSRARRLGATD